MDGRGRSKRQPQALLAFRRGWGGVGGCLRRGPERPSFVVSSLACPGLERIWEADLEACHLFLRGLQLRTPSCGGGDAEDPPPAEGYLLPEPHAEEEEDCAMLTALGGRWCPEANLQNSEFTKVRQTQPTSAR